MRRFGPEYFAASASAFILLTSLLGSALPKAPAQIQPSKNFDYDKYVVGTLRQIIEYHSDFAADPKNRSEKQELGFSADQVPTKVRVKYTGVIHPIPQTRKEMLYYWTKSYKVSPQYTSLFKQEMLFKEGSDDHWLPVQTQLIPFFRKELKNGDEVDLFTIWVGYRVTRESVDWLFLVNEFQKPRSQPVYPKRAPNRI